MKALNRRQLKYCRQRAQGANVAESARVAGCAESTAFVWEKLPEVVAEVAALRSAVGSSSDAKAEVAGRDDPESILRRSIEQCARRGDHRAIAPLVAQLRLILENRTSSGLLEQVRRASPDELVAALEQCVDDPHLWGRIGDVAHARSLSAQIDWLDALALTLSGVWPREEHREAWRSDTGPLFALAGVLGRVPRSTTGGYGDVRAAIADARAALDRLDSIYASPTDAAEFETAPK